MATLPPFLIWHDNDKPKVLVSISTIFLLRVHRWTKIKTKLDFDTEKAFTTQWHFHFVGRLFFSK